MMQYYLKNNFAILALVLVITVQLINAEVKPVIVGGQTARVGQFPYQVSLQRNNIHFCGGSIISARYILTAAHCVTRPRRNQPPLPMRPNEVSIRVGAVRYNAGGTLMATAQIKVHPQYVMPRNDIALIQVQGNIAFNARVRAIRMGRTAPRVGTDVTVSGWGDRVTNGTTPVILRYTRLKVITDSECTRRTGVNDPGTFCLGSPAGRGICQGDSGGPAVVRGVLIGVASFTLRRCGTAGPDGFAKVSSYRSWIDTNSR